MKNVLITLAIVSKLVSGCGDSSSPSGIPVLPEQQPTGEENDKTKKSEVKPDAVEENSPVIAQRSIAPEPEASSSDGLVTVASVSAGETGNTGSVSGALKLTDPTCQDPAVSEVKVGIRFMKCDGTWAEGTMPATVTVTVTPTPIPSCTSNRQIGCVTTSTYESANLASLAPSNIRQGTNIAGVDGSLVATAESHTECTGNAQVGCITTSTWKSADFTNIVPSKLKAGTWVAGVLGQYPSASFPLSSDTSTSDLDLLSFNSKLASSAAFEWFDSAGNRYSNNGSTALTAANVMTGVSVFGVTGTLSPGEQPNAWDIRYGVSVNGITGLSKMSCRSDTTDTALKCDYASWTADSNVNGHMTKTDRITGLTWNAAGTGSGYTKAWANTLCANLSTATGETWRVPSLAEINNAFVHQIDYVFGTNLSNIQGNRIWSTSSFYAAGKTEAQVLLDSVSTAATVFCVK